MDIRDFILYGLIPILAWQTHLLFSLSATVAVLAKQVEILERKNV